MSIEVMNAVWRNSGSTGRQKLVLLAIADHQGELGAWPSISTLASMVNASERSVQRDIQELVSMGELIVEERMAPTRSKYRANLYWVNVPGAPEIVEVTESVLEVTDSTLEVTESGLEVTPVVMLNLNRNLKETIYPPHEVEEAFQKFYNAYPRKREPLAARKAFAKALEHATPDVIVAGAERLAADPNLPPKQFIPYPATWLNSGGWDDEPYEERILSAEEKKKLELDELQARREREAIAREEQAERDRIEREAFRREREENPVERCEHGRIIYVCRVCGPNVVTEN